MADSYSTLDVLLHKGTGEWQFKNPLVHASKCFSVLHLLLSSSPFALDIALKIGGLPKGRVVEIYGPEASGKTTLALHVISEAQKQGVGKLPASQANPEVVSAFRREEKEQAMRLLDNYLRICCAAKVNLFESAHAQEVKLRQEAEDELRTTDCGEQALSLVDTLIRSGSVDVIVVDSA
ncbi:hypothetical protein AAHE18_06G128700 [Arachis hypogaea]